MLPGFKENWNKRCVQVASQIWIQRFSRKNSCHQKNTINGSRGLRTTKGIYRAQSKAGVAKLLPMSFLKMRSCQPGLAVSACFEAHDGNQIGTALHVGRVEQIA
jgi:hypothetical protein